MNIRRHNTIGACASAAAFLLSACQGELAVVDDLDDSNSNLATSTNIGGPCGCTNTNSLMALGCGEGDVPLLENDIVQTTHDGSVVAFNVTDDLWFRLLYWNGGASTIELAPGLLRGLSASGDRLLIEAPAPTLIDLNGGSTVVPLRVPAGHGALSASGDSLMGVASSNNVNHLARVDTNTGTVALLGELGPNDFWVDGSYVKPDGSGMVGSAHEGLGSFSANAFRWTEQQGLVFGLAGAPAGDHLPEALSTDGSVIAGRTLDQDVYFRWTEAQGYQVIASASDYSATWLSADGSVGLGSLKPTNGNDTSAFRWKAATGAVEIAPRTASLAIDMSDDGNVIVAQSWDENQLDGAPPEQTFVWDSVHGTRTLEEVLQERGVTVEGWEFFQPRVLSGDGNVLLGRGTCGGVPTLYRVVLSG